MNRKKSCAESTTQTQRMPIAAYTYLALGRGLRPVPGTHNLHKTSTAGLLTLPRLRSLPVFDGCWVIGVGCWWFVL